ncbi:MAG: hypothetical protein E7099_09150 [Mediterranea massiliensis]|nr:hypothetical protein [Mediterranea massiliensis]
MKPIYFLLTSLLIVASCTQPSSYLEMALEAAGENRGELERVLTHYKDSTLKRRAAEFLIENMVGFSVPDSNLLPVYQRFYDRCEPLKQYKQEDPDRWARSIDTLWREFKDWPDYRPLTYKPLLQVVKASELIEEIELAFRSHRENRYAKGSSFELFLEHVLPFHFGNNFVKGNYRKELYERYHHRYYRNKQADLFEETDSLLALYKENAYCEFDGADVKLIHPDALTQVGGGFCAERTVLNSLLFTALGMPVAVDFVPAWGNRKHSHLWNVLLVDGKHYACDPFENKHGWIHDELYSNRGMYHPEGLGEFRAPKVYRKCYSNHTETTLIGKGVSREDIPDLFMNYKKIDVTEQYMECSDVTVELTEPAPKGAKYAYLCVYQFGEWKPVQYGKIEGGKARFEKMGRHIVYMPMYCKERRMIPAAQPVMLEDDGSTTLLTAEGISGERLVTRNIIAETFRNREYIKCMTGTVITDEKGDTLCSIGSVLPIRRTAFDTDSCRVVRKVWIQLPSDSICLGELAFHTEEGRIQGVSICSPIKGDREEEPLAYMLDNYPATGFRGRVKNRKVEVDLGGEYRLKQVVMAPYVVSQMFPESTYELQCWRNGEWELLERKNGTTEDICFEKIPCKALMRIVQTAQGENDRRVLERPFLYRNGEIVWL